MMPQVGPQHNNKVNNYVTGASLLTAVACKNSFSVLVQRKGQCDTKGMDVTNPSSQGHNRKKNFLREYSRRDYGERGFPTRNDGLTDFSFAQIVFESHFYPQNRNVNFLSFTRQTLHNLTHHVQWESVYQSVRSNGWKGPEDMNYAVRWKEGSSPREIHEIEIMDGRRIRSC
ncbi:hypothetical protein CBL_01650 [Carabus blaptoides fortunei]